jgi:hypothetical protein
MHVAACYRPRQEAYNIFCFDVFQNFKRTKFLQPKASLVMKSPSICPDMLTDITLEFSVSNSLYIVVGSAK